MSMDINKYGSPSGGHIIHQIAHTERIRSSFILYKDRDVLNIE